MATFTKSAKIVVDGTYREKSPLPSLSADSKAEFAQGHAVTVTAIVKGREETLVNGRIQLALLQACSPAVKAAIKAAGVDAKAVHSVAVKCKSKYGLDNVIGYLIKHYKSSSDFLAYEEVSKKPISTYYEIAEAASALSLFFLQEKLFERVNKKVTYSVKKNSTFGPQIGDLKRFYALDISADDRYRVALSKSIAQAYLSKTLRNVDEINDFMEKNAEAAKEILAQQEKLAPSKEAAEAKEVTHITTSLNPQVLDIPRPAWDPKWWKTGNMTA